MKNSGRSTWHTLAMRLRCVRRTPFGRLVVPLENGRASTSRSGFTATGRREVAGTLHAALGLVETG